MSKMYKIGDVVKIKSGVQDELTGIFMENWQGRVIEHSTDAETGEALVCVEWDSITARNLPIQYIMMSNQEDADWSTYYLLWSEVEPALARDTPQEAERVIRDLDAKYYWQSLGEQGQRVQTVVGELDLDDDTAAFKIWRTYLGQSLKFPFDAEVLTAMQGGHAREGEIVKVIQFTDIDDLLGIMVKVSSKKGIYDHALCDLSATAEDSPNFLPLSDYCFWYDNTTDYDESEE